MTRRRFISWLLLGLIVASAIAVQHDTFLRRWLVGSRFQQLGKVVPQVKFEHVDEAHAFEHLSRIAAVPIRLPEKTPRLLRGGSYTNKSVDLILCEMMFVYSIDDLIPYDDDGAIQFRKPRTGVVAARYDVGDLLPPADAAAPGRLSSSSTARSNAQARLRRNFQTVREYASHARRTTGGEPD